MTAAAPFNVEKCLVFDPYAGDFGDPGDRLLRDNVVKARKPGECHCCGGDIVPGTWTRTRVDRFEGALHQARWCQDCCVAMVASEDLRYRPVQDGDEDLPEVEDPWEIRCQLRLTRAPPAS